MYDMMQGAWGHDGMWIGAIGMLLFWGVALFGLVALVRWMMTRSGEKASAQPPDAMEILKQRYARGEMERDQYLQMRADLLQRDPGPKS